MTINKRVKRIFLEHKATYIGIILLIFLSTSCFLGLKTAATSIEKNVNENRISANVEDANFSYSNKLTVEEMTSLAKKFDLELQENRQIEYIYNNATLRVRPVFTDINKFSVYDGETLKDDNDIMVDRFFFKAQKLSFGDNIKVGDKDFIVCGIFTTPDYLSMLKSKTDFMCDGSKFGLCLVSDKAFKSIANGKETVFYSVVFHKNNSDAFRKELSKAGIVLKFTSQEANIRIKTFDGEITSVLAWCGYLLAVPLTSIIIQVFFDTLTRNMFFAFSVRLEIWQGFAGLAFILCIYYTTLFITKRKVLNINMAESLKARE